MNTAFSQILSRVASLELDYHDYLVNTTKNFNDSLGLNQNNLNQDTAIIKINNEIIHKVTVYLNKVNDSLDFTAPFETLKKNTDLLAFNNDLDNLERFIVEFEEIFELYNTVNYKYMKNILSVVKLNGTFIDSEHQNTIEEKLTTKALNSQTNVNGVISMEDIERKADAIKFREIHL